MLNESQIRQIYEQQIGRTPRADEVQWWATSGKPVEALQAAARQEAQASMPNFSQLYQDVLGRPGEQFEVNWWNSASQNANPVAARQAFENAAQAELAQRRTLTPGGLQRQPVGNPFAYNQQNPSLDQMSQVVMQQANENLLRNQLPQIGSAAIAAGGYGGSRQGVVEANALRDANAQIANALTGMRFGDYNNQLKRQLQRYATDLNYNLGVVQLGLGLQNSRQNFFTAQRGQDLQQTQLGASLLGQGTQGLLGQGQGLFGVGQTQQQAPWQVVNNAAGAVSPFTGFGQSTTTSGGNNPWGNMLGGALAGAQFARLF